MSYKQAIYNCQPTNPSKYHPPLLAYITMSSEMLQQLYFSQRTLREDLLGEDICNLLDRDAFVGL
jgi:hypothetical protein